MKAKPLPNHLIWSDCRITPVHPPSSLNLHSSPYLYPSLLHLSLLSLSHLHSSPSLSSAFIHLPTSIHLSLSLLPPFIYLSLSCLHSSHSLSLHLYSHLSLSLSLPPTISTTLLLRMEMLNLFHLLMHNPK